MALFALDTSISQQYIQIADRWRVALTSYLDSIGVHGGWLECPGLLC
jgi:hypothetical protein